MNEKKTREFIVNMDKTLQDACCEFIKCEDCPYGQKDRLYCTSYAFENALLLAGFENNKENAKPIHEIMIKAIKEKHCFGAACESCQYGRLYGDDCFTQYVAKRVYDNGWRKRNDTQERHSTNQ